MPTYTAKIFLIPVWYFHFLSWQKHWMSVLHFLFWLQYYGWLPALHFLSWHQILDPCNVFPVLTSKIKSLYCSSCSIPVQTSNIAFPVLSSDTGQPRYLKVQGNGENTLSYPKFDISKMWRHPNTMYMFNFSKTYFCSTCVVKLFLLKTGLKRRQKKFILVCFISTLIRLWTTITPHP